ncbi:hypothetical protein DET47_12913 [Shewanella putrefaciens]|nr:hypothetical protein DET47_12913 [Shewanella putrefaciens]
MTISIFNRLRGLKAHAIIPTVATPLDKEHPQQSRWTRHPHAVTQTGNSDNHIPYTGAVRGYIQNHCTVFGGMDWEPKKTPPMRLSCLGRSLAATQFTFTKQTVKVFIMLYTFLIAYRDQKLAQLARIRTVSTIANTEQAARNQLNGMPLVFVCRTPANDNSCHVGGEA